MNARTLTRFGSCLLVAALATGCAPLRGVRPGSGAPADRSAPAPASPAAAAPESIPGGTVVAAGGGAAAASPEGTALDSAPPAVPGAAAPGAPPAPPGAVAPAGAAPNPAQVVPQPAQPPGALATPRALPPTPNWPPGDPRQAQQGQPAQAQQPQQPPVMMPPVAPPGTAPLHPRAAADPHIRNTPTATGGRLALAPYEVPTDRVIELTMHLERLLAQNRDLAARAKELEGVVAARDQALEEAKREVDAVAADAAKTRAALQAQIAGLQGRIKQLEEEDVIFLRAVIDALGKLFPERKP